MEYFGTSLTEYGHYTWDISGEYMVRIGLMPKTNFDPYELNKGERGSVVFKMDENYTILAINGSCKDERNGTKTVFWLRELLSREQMIDRIKKNKLAMAIINQMPFEVKW